MGKGRKRRRSARSPQSSPPSPSRRRTKLEVDSTGDKGPESLEKDNEVEKTEVIRVEKDKRVEETDVTRVEKGKGVVMTDDRRDGGDGVSEGVRRVIPSFWESQSSEQLSWSAHPDHVQQFAVDNLKNPLLANLVVDTILFELRHDTLRFWLCQLCDCYFRDGDSLISHMKEHHFPEISKWEAWPLPNQRDQKSASIQDYLCKMVWKPIDVSSTLRQFYMLCLDSELESVKGSQGEIRWPLSYDDPERSQLLINLGQELEALACDDIGLYFLSSGLLQHLISVASWHILARLPSRDHMLEFTRRLASSPQSLCFLEKESLCHFVRVVKSMRQLVILTDNWEYDPTVASIWKEVHGDVSTCEISSKDSPQLEISVVTPWEFHFSLKPAHGDYQSIYSWLENKPSDIPCSGPLRLSLHHSSFLTQMSSLLGDCQHATQSMNMHISSFNEVLKETYYSIVRKWLQQPAVETGSANVESRNEYLSKIDTLGLRVVESFSVLESWNFKVRCLCSFDFSSFILPLLQQFFKHQPRNSLFSKEVRTEELHYGDRRSGISGFTNLSAFDDVRKVHNPNLLSVAAKGTWDTDHSGLFYCVAEDDLMQVINNSALNTVRDAISHIRFHKTWRHWYCGCCREIFIDRESHTNHIHKSALSFDEQFGLVPRAPSKHEIDRLLGLDWLMMEGPRKTFFHSDGDHMEYHAVLTEIKELLYSVLEEEPVLFSASSHLVHLAEFARVVLFENLKYDNHVAVAREIDESSQLVFSMLDTNCLHSILEFLKNLCTYCKSQLQVQRSTDLFNVANCGISYADRTFLVDPQEYSKAFFLEKEAMDKERRPSVRKHESYLKFRAHSDQKLCSLRGQFDAKREVLRKLDVVFALDRILIRGSDHAGTLRSRHEKLESMVPSVQCTFQYHLISKLLCEASSRSIEKALDVEKFKLLYQLDYLDVHITQELVHINELNRKISDLCFRDYGTAILPYMGVFLNPRIRVDDEISCWANNKLEELLCSIDRSDLLYIPANFKVTSASIGKVIVNITACKWGLGFDYRGMRLDFEGEWSFILKGKKVNGWIDFLGLSDWHANRSEDIQAEVEVCVDGDMQHNAKDLAPSLKLAICGKLLKFQGEFVQKSAPKIPDTWYYGDVPLPFPNEPFVGKHPLKKMKAECLELVTDGCRQLGHWKMHDYRDDDW